MSRFRKYVLILPIVFLVSLGSPLTSSAQVQPTDPGCDPLDPACPIDGGVSLLIAAAIGIGAKKAYNQKKKNNTIEI
ncbi:MAG: hypothetical protein QM737_01715 [Ferruginibacter sp.]